MPRNGSGVFSHVPGTDAVSGQTIDSDSYNQRMDDYETDANTPRPVVAGGTGADNAADALTNLGAQASDGDLAAIAALGFSARALLKKTAANTWTLQTTSNNVDSILSAADYAAIKALLAVTTSDVSGLGTAAVKNTGVSGNNVALLDGANTWSAVQTLSANAVVGDGTSSKSLTLKGANSGSAGGTLLIGNNGGAAAWAIGNYSAIFGGSYDPDIIIYNAINDGKYYVALSGLKKEIVNTDNVVTMTNKTLSSPTLSGTVAGSATLSGVITHSNTVAMQSSNEVQFFSSGYSIRASTGLEIKTADSIRFLVGSTEYGRVDNTGLKARIAVSSETSGTLTSASANKQIDAAGGITIPASTFTAGDVVVIYAGASSRTITQGSGGTQRLHGTSTTGNLTLAARGMCAVRFISATEWVVTGDVS